jgi:hypothetical protein
MPDLTTNERVFGVANIEFVKQDAEYSLAYRLTGPGMVIMSMLSDVQEMLHCNDLERARQRINIIKYLISEWNLGFNDRGER